MYKILSPQAAEGVRCLVLDIKWGSGCYQVLLIILITIIMVIICDHHHQNLTGFLGGC